jgi:DUF4097 and DUF4098 domain-containing protein YvlB
MSEGKSRRIYAPRFLGVLALSASFGCLGACGVSINGGDDDDATNKVNGSVQVQAGKPASDVRTVNGSVHIEDNAKANSATTVNGSVHLGPHSSATSLKTVNGAISLDSGAHAADAKAVNGDMTLQQDSDLSGSLVNVNGEITLNSAHVGGGIKTVSGNIKVLGQSHVEGGILVQQPSGTNFFGNQDPTIVIGPGATVQGELKFERKVHLYVSDHATIGTVVGATPISFTGDNPPANP